MTPKPQKTIAFADFGRKPDLVEAMLSFIEDRYHYLNFQTQCIASRPTMVMWPSSFYYRTKFQFSMIGLKQQSSQCRTLDQLILTAS